MASPSMTQGAAGNVLASQGLAASASATTATFTVAAKFEDQLQVAATFGTIAATAGLQVDVFRVIGSTPLADTDPITSLVLVAVAGARRKSIALPTGQYQVKLTNLDATNALTLVSITGDTLDAIS